MLAITNATILTSEERIEGGTVVVENGRIQSISSKEATPISPTAKTLDAGGLLLAPGFIDLQLNGGFGHDFTQSPETIWTVAAQLPCYGVTSFLPTIITSPPAQITTAQKAIAERPAAFRGAEPLGLHLEGPYLNPEQKGAHDAELMRLPETAEYRNWSPATGVRLVTLAPEIPGALDAIRTLSANGVIVSAGHSTAALTEAQAGIDAGIRYGTHLFNAMRALHHREPGLPGALLDDERVTLGLIADGVHVHPALIRLVWRLAAERLTLVTDAMAALGMAAGTYRLGDFAVTVGEERATLADGTLAGSILSLDQALRNLMAFTGCSAAEALPTITSIPARLLGLERKGHIAPDYNADLVLLTADAEVVATIVKGEIVYQVE